MVRLDGEPCIANPAMVPSVNELAVLLEVHLLATFAAVLFGEVGLSYLLVTLPTTKVGKHASIVPNNLWPLK